MPMKARNDGSQEIHVIVDSMIGHDRASPVDHGYWIPAWKHCGLNADWNERAWRLSPGRPSLDPGFYLFEDAHTTDALKSMLMRRLRH